MLFSRSQAPVVQWIELLTPNEAIHVRLMAGAQKGILASMEKAPTTLEDLKELLEETLSATEENNKLLKAMRRDAVIGSIVKILIWTALVGLSLYFSIQFLEPYLGLLQNVPQGTGEGVDYGALIEEYRSLLGQ